MQARFLIGPAGSGKTFRCLAEIRAELCRDPAGPPLLLLAPKQATFQLERQLLADAALAGYTRLQILSFDRLARLILEEIGLVPGVWLDDEGRVMVLRALLARHQSDLKIFHATARLPGFATRLSLLLRELQRHQLPPGRLRALGEKLPTTAELRNKLHDFARLLEGYLGWLHTHGLQDADSLLEVAAASLRGRSAAEQARRPFQLAGLWLDGFAELTGQELDLLAAVVPHSERTTLAFCLPAEIRDEPPWRSTWAVVGQTFLRCRERIAQLSGVTVTTESLPVAAQPTRFSRRPVLAQLVSRWDNPGSAVESPPGTAGTITGYVCANPEMEAVLAAREIRRFVMGGGRYREVAVLLRALDDHAATLRRVFARYEIPCFLDRREPVAHHPLAELTRSALRTVAFNWRPADWFGAWKAGLLPAAEEELDWLENLALEHGWEGNTWRTPLVIAGRDAEAHRAEQLRQRLLPPFATLAQQTAGPINGPALAAALREFWHALSVEKVLARWTESSAAWAARLPHSPIHQTVWDQLLAWLENVELAFATEALPVREWLPILESGLTSLTVGVIPPALDQVLIGAIDRSRNPDLKLALVLGLNEGVFPAPPAEDPLLTELERDALNDAGARLGPGHRRKLGHEWFYGYIAASRASERVVFTRARQDAAGNPLNPSAFWAHLERILPEFKPTDWTPPAGFADALHRHEILAPAIQLPAEHPIAALPEMNDVLSRARAVTEAQALHSLTPAAAANLYGRELFTSVSALENFAACPFKFFVGHGLRAQERREFELDARQRGSFQHDLLKRFHEDLVAEGKRWRDVTPAAARERVRRLGAEMLPAYQSGLFAANPARQFEGELLTGALESLIDVLITWARDYQFDPALVEAGFGVRDATWPGWRLELPDGGALVLRGRLDRVDVWRDPTGGPTRVVVLDYKSSSRAPEPLKLRHGLQLQLPLYLAVLENLPAAAATLGATQLAAAGVFYVNLRGEFPSASSRTEALEDPEASFRRAFQHFGRYDGDLRALLDPTDACEQFRSRKTSDCMATADFREFIRQAERHLQEFGRQIFSGVIAPAPFRKGSETACQQCEYRSICRFDPWTQPYRPLRKD